MSNSAIFIDLKEELKKRIPKKYYESFFEGLKFVKITDERIILKTSDYSIKNHIESKYKSVVQDSLKALNKNVSLDIILEQNENPKKNQIAIKSENPFASVVKIKKFLEQNYDYKRDLITTRVMIKKKDQKNYQAVDSKIISDIFIELKSQLEYSNCSIADLELILSSSFVPDYNVLKEFLENLEWDGKDHLSEICECVHTTNNLDFKNYFEKWLLRSFKGALSSDSYFVNENAFVLQGPGHHFKTTFINSLFPKEIKNFTNSSRFRQMQERDILKLLSFTWYWFLDEIDKIVHSKEASEIRYFLSNQGGLQRGAYQKHEINYKRITSVICALNKTQFLFNEETGNRRFIIFSLSEPIDINRANKVNKNQLFAQLYYKYKNMKSSQIHWTEKEKKEIIENNLQYEISSHEVDMIERYFEPCTKEEAEKNSELCVWKTSTDIQEFLLNAHPKLQFEIRWIGRAMTKLNFIKNKNKTYRSYLVKLRNKKHLEYFTNV